MIQITRTTHVLEIAGPRGQIWRPALSVVGDLFRDAQGLAEQGNMASALRTAEDAYIAAHGDMHGVAFRVRSIAETLTGLGSPEGLLAEPM